MGLDNIPKKYPCKENNLAILDANNKIDCQKTQDIGHCPYKNLRDGDPLVNTIRPVYGILGAYCWYRGKYGNYLLDIIVDDDVENPPIDFYGDLQDNGDGPIGLTVENCLVLSDWMVQHTERFFHAADVKGKLENWEQTTIDVVKQDWIYATWWLRFAAAFCGGSDVWY